MSIGAGMENDEGFLLRLYRERVKEQLKETLRKDMEPLIEAAANAALADLKTVLELRTDQLRSHLLVHVEVTMTKKDAAETRS
jgi:hypothetical protein